MIRTVFAWALLVSTQASRIQEHSILQSQTQTKFGATCEDLQNTFHIRVAAIEESIGGTDEHSELGAIARTRLMMRMHGIMRTLRRARECSWVIENNSDDLVQLRGVVQQLLAGNPCAEAARVEMEGASDENPEVIPRAMGILLSDDCEAPETPQDANIDATPEEQLQFVEDEVQDALDEFAANSDESAFFEVDKTQRAQFLRFFLTFVGVFFFTLFFLMTCVSVAAYIGYLLGIALVVLLNYLQISLVRQAPMNIMFNGGFLGMAVGLSSCVYQLFNTILPAVQSNLHSNHSNLQ